MSQFAFGSSRFQWTDTKGWVRTKKKLMMSSHSCSIQHGISIIVKSCILENAKIARVGRVEAISSIMAKKEMAKYIVKWILIHLQGIGS